MKVLKLLILFSWEALKSAFWSVLLSAFFCLCKWLGSLMSITDKPEMSNFVGGAMGIFAVLFIYKMFWIIRDTVRRKKDPMYDVMANSTGISYNDYKKLKDKK